MALTCRVIWQPPLVHYMLKRYIKLYLQVVLELRLTVPWGVLAFQMCSEVDYIGLFVKLIVRMYCRQGNC